jgi:glycine C-acetyltransferase
MKTKLLQHLASETSALHDQGLFKHERVLNSPQQGHVRLEDGTEVINLCANNYLGLSNHPELIHAAHEALDRYGYGMSSVRFICGTQDVHKQLEATISTFLKTEDTILYSSCFDANTGLFETLLNDHDAVISDELNHASIIDGIRLCKARRLRYRNNDMDDLEAQLKASQDCCYRLIATDGVFSMDGSFARLTEICDLADRYDALVMVDDSHAVGFIGETGRGTPELHDCVERVDIITGTLGKALGGASGGYTSGRREIIAWLRQRSRPYLFSNTLAPVIAATSIRALELVASEPELRSRLLDNTEHFRAGMQVLGFELVPGAHPIIPVMLGDASLAARMSESLLSSGIYVIGFSFPVVAKGKARIRTQMSAALSQADIDTALRAFADAGRELGILTS